MDNDTKIFKEQTDNIKADFEKAKNEGKDPTSIFEKYLSKEEATKAKQVLSDPKKLKELLSSPFAKSFMQKYKNKE